MKPEYMYLLVMPEMGDTINEDSNVELFMSKSHLKDFIEDCALDNDPPEINCWTIFTIDPNSGWHVRVERVTTIGGLDD